MRAACAAAAGTCAGLPTGGHPWRVPSLRELATLVDEAQVAPAINRTMFPNTKSGSKSNTWYWASHRAAGNAPAASAINFDDGFTGLRAGALRVTRRLGMTESTFIGSTAIALGLRGAGGGGCGSSGSSGGTGGAG